MTGIYQKKKKNDRKLKGIVQEHVTLLAKCGEPPQGNYVHYLQNAGQNMHCQKKLGSHLHGSALMMALSCKNSLATVRSEGEEVPDLHLMQHLTRTITLASWQARD